MVDLSFITNFFSQLNLDKFFMNPAGLYALLAVLPLIIFYLIKPKPKDKIIPSLMFILSKKEKFLENSFFRRLMNDLLFLLQLLTLIILATAIAMPYFPIIHDVSTEDTALVFDMSGSMNTAVNGVNSQTRYSFAKEKAKDYFSDKNTVVFASDIPELMLKDGSRGDADNILAKSKPRDTGTNLGDAIQFASDQLQNHKGKVVVFSDFINSDTDPVAIKNVLESKDIKVDFVDLSSPADNAGIIDLNLDEQTSTVFIKNYNDKEADVILSISGATQPVIIQPGSLESVSFTTPKGKSTIEIQNKDDFLTDNYAYISTPTQEKTNILFIFNAGKSNLYYALAANPKNNVETAVPPIVPNVNHDVYVIQDVSKDLLLPETIRKISESLANGNILIVAGNNNIFDIDFKDMLPVQKPSTTENTEPSYVKIQQINKFTKDAEFGKVSYYQNIKPKPGAIVIASSENTNSTLVAYAPYKGGKVIFYNINDAQSEFKTSLTYPLFWNSMVDTLIDKDSIQSLNYKTGQSVSGQRLINAGFIDLGAKSIAVNMLNDKESDVGKQGNISELSAGTSEEKFKIIQNTPLDTYFILIAIVLMFVEFLYVKFRGDF